MPFLGKTPAQGFVNSVTKDDFTPNGSTTAFTLSKTPATVNEIEVYVGNVRQEPTDAYSVSGTTLTMTEAPATNTNFYVMHIGGTTQSSTVVGDGTVTSAKLSGALTTPSNLTVDGDLAVDTSTFVVDSSNNRVGVGVTSPQDHFHVVGTNGGKIRIGETDTRYTQIQGASSGSGLEADMLFYNTNSSGTPTTNLQIMGSGRGVSDFTIRAWINFNGTGTIAIRDSHNISSIVDGATGDYVVNFAAGMPSANYATGLGIGGAAVLISSGRGGMNYNTTSAYRIGVRDGTTEAWTDTELVTAMWCGG